VNWPTIKLLSINIIYVLSLGFYNILIFNLILSNFKYGWEKMSLPIMI